MIINKESDYALRIIRSLSGGHKRTMKDLCDEQKIPQQFAYKIIKKLAKNGIIKSTRGVSGGCILIKKLTDISLYDLIVAVDSEKFISSCMNPDFSCDWNNENHNECAVHIKISQIQKKFCQDLKNVSLAELFPERG